MPPSFGVHGPGEIIMWLGFLFSISEIEILSFLATSMLVPKAPICCTRL